MRSIASRRTRSRGRQGAERINRKPYDAPSRASHGLHEPRGIPEGGERAASFADAARSHAALMDRSQRPDMALKMSRVSPAGLLSKQVDHEQRRGLARALGHSRRIQIRLA